MSAYRVEKKHHFLRIVELSEQVNDFTSYFKNYPVTPKLVFFLFSAKFWGSPEDAPPLNVDPPCATDTVLPMTEEQLKHRIL